jgi:hypothetical protein
VKQSAFTSIEALSQQEVKTKIVSHVADGARWKTRIILVNMDTVPARIRRQWADREPSKPTGRQLLRQIAAGPLLTSGRTKLLLPFDRGLDLGVALANASPAHDASITKPLCNEQGAVISSDVVSLPRRAHTAFGLTNPSARPEDQRGVVEFSSPVEFFSLGIRGNNGAFTAIRALGK